MIQWRIPIVSQEVSVQVYQIQRSRTSACRLLLNSIIRLKTDFANRTQSSAQGCFFRWKHNFSIILIRLLRKICKSAVSGIVGILLCFSVYIRFRATRLARSFHSLSISFWKARASSFALLSPSRKARQYFDLQAFVSKFPSVCIFVTTEVECLRQWWTVIGIVTNWYDIFTER